MSDTPETDAAWDKYINFPYTYGAVDLRILAQRLERERDELMKDVRKLQDVKQKHEHEELVAAQENDRLKIKLDDAREALMKIEEIFIDGGDTYLDFVRVGNIAREFLERNKD